MNSIVSTFMPARRCALFCAFALSTAFSASALDLPGLPPAGPPRHSSLAPIKEKTLDNGLRVIAVLRTGLPIFTGEMLRAAQKPIRPSWPGSLTSPPIS
jgi:hypothetical protein